MDGNVIEFPMRKGDMDERGERPLRKKDRDNWAAFDAPFLWPTREINLIAERYKDDLVDGHDAGRSVAEAIAQANDGRWKVGGKWFAMDAVIPKACRQDLPSAYRAAGAMPMEGNVFDHAMMIRGRATRPGKTRGWMAPAGVITMPYAADEERLRLGLLETLPGTQAVIPSNTTSWWYPGRTLLGVVLRSDVEFSQIFAGRPSKGRMQ